MKIVIDIPEEMYEAAKTDMWCGSPTLGYAIKKGTPYEERPHGEWLSHYEYCKKHDCIPSGLIAFWWCNKCEQGVEIPTNFCPNCGASMRKEGATE